MTKVYPMQIFMGSFVIRKNTKEVVSHFFAKQPLFINQLDIIVFDLF